MQEFAGERDSRGVIARREGDDTALAFVGGELRHRVVRAAKLERACALQVFALEEDGGAGALVDRA